jgi:hypothetical protein
MSTEKKIIVAVLICVSALLITNSGSIVAGNGAIPVERPFRIHGETTVNIDWENQSVDTDGRPIVPLTMKASQVSTEGWSDNQGQGVLYLDTFVNGIIDSVACRSVIYGVKWEISD